MLFGEHRLFPKSDGEAEIDRTPARTGLCCARSPSNAGGCSCAYSQLGNLTSAKSSFFIIFWRRRETSAVLFVCLLKPVKYCVLLRADEEFGAMNEWGEELEEEDKGMVQLEVVWEEVDLFLFFQTSDWCQLLTRFIWKHEKDKKNKLW